MSSKRRSYDTDEITLRKVFAKSAIDNKPIGGLRVLTADGEGGTYWAVPSTLGVLPSFNQINTPAGNFTADLSYNVFNFLAGTNIGYSKGEGLNELYIYSKGFSEFDISGNNPVYAFQSNVLNPVVKFSGTGGINIRSDTQNNIITFDGQGVPISSSLFSFQKAKVLSNTSTVNGGISSLSNYYILNAESPSSILTFVGVGDVFLNTDQNTNSLFVTINASTGTFSTLTGLISTISTQYTQLTDFSTACINLSTISQSNFSTSVSTSYGINSNLSITVFNLPFANYTTLTQFNYTTNLLQQGISTVSTNYASLPALFSTSTGINDRISTFNIISTISTVEVIGGTVTGFTANNVYYNNGDVSTLSTAVGYSILSTLGLLSSGLSTLSTTIGTTEYLFFTSTTAGLGTANYISSSQLLSSINGLSNIAVTKITGGNNVLISPLSGVGDITVNVPYATDLVSTVVGLGTYGYISSSSYYSTFQGLGTYGYVSTASLFSSVNTLGKLGYISSPSLASTVTGLGTIGYISTKNVSFTSSIYYEGNNGFLSGTPSGTNDFYFSSADIYLDKFSTYITSTSKITIDYNYSMIFPNTSRGLGIGSASNINNYAGILFCSTLLSYNSQPDFNNTNLYTSLLALPSNYFGSESIFYSNVVSHRDLFQVSTFGLFENYSKPLQVLHYFPSSLYIALTPTEYFYGLADSNTTLLCSSTNSIFVSIYNN